MNRSETTIGVIGGSGLYDMEGMTDVSYIDVDTPFGKPSAEIVVGSLDGTRVAFLPRHGRGHRLNPTSIPARANIYALKTLGVQRLISVSANGKAPFLMKVLSPMSVLPNLFAPTPERLFPRQLKNWASLPTPGEQWS